MPAGRGCAGAWRTIGYDERLGGYEDVHLTAARSLASRPKQPVFLSVGFFETHREFAGLDDRDEARCMPLSAPLPELPPVSEDFTR